MAEERVQRRLAAILFADAVGSSLLLERNEAAALAALKHALSEVIEPQIARRSGRVLKLMGDGALAVFDSAVDAVDAAIAIQTEMSAGTRPDGSELRFRIGINVGDVIVEGDDIYGEAVGLAARIQALADPGGIAVSHAVRNHVRGKVSAAFVSMGEQPLKNLTEPVEVFRVDLEVLPKRPSAEPASSPAQTAKPSIAVLPFTNMSGDSSQEYFSDGITEDIITDLSRFRFLFVIARNSSFAYKGQTLDVQEIGRNLGVGYVVEGSIRRAGNRVRVTAQLIDAGTGGHLWAERYDRDLDDIFLVQDEIARRIVTSLVPRIEAEGIDVAKRKPPQDMRAYDYYLRAKALFGWPRDGADLRQARAYCDRALAIDPSYARAHAQKAFSYVLGLVLMDADDVGEWRRQAVACAETAVALDPMDGFCHWSLGEAAFQARDIDRARDQMARAQTINPNDADVLAVSGYISALAGDPEAGLQQMAMALERNPISPSWYHWLRGIILYVLGRFEEALRALKLHSPANPGMLRTRAATLVELGRIDEARADVQTLLAMRPGVTISEVRRYLDFMPDLDRYLDNLRRAGLPE
jgi:adenylate cyclase